jgi:phenylpropionate dioxygenase-like ring-hydroxylating dioxygenase large terminal subunit
MQHSMQVELIERWLSMYHAGATQLADDVYEVDTAVYRSPEWFAREQRALFRNGVVLGCLSADIPNPGDFTVIESGGIPIILSRDGDGHVRAFLNACRHRAAPLLEGCGHRARNFVCPFHNWTYALDGALLGQPRSQEGFATLARDTLGLAALPVAEVAGLVFVRPEGDEPIEAASALCGLGPELESYALSSYVRYGHQRRTWRCNWKLLLDTFMESYHVFALHGASVGPDYPGHVMVFDTYGPNMRIPVPRASLLELEQRPRAEWSLLPHATVQYFVAPNAMVNHTIDHVILWRFVPAAADRTVAEMTMYVPERVGDDEWRRSMDDWFELHDAVTRDEDYPESERIQAVLESGRVATTMLGRNEGAVQHFQACTRVRVEREAVESIEPVR